MINFSKLHYIGIVVVIVVVHVVDVVLLHVVVNFVEISEHITI